DWIPARAAKLCITAGATVLLLAYAPAHLDDVFRPIPHHFVASVPEEPIPRVGYVVPGAFDRRMLADVRRITSAYLGPGDTIFDFSNSPALFHYFLELKPATRYYDVSMAIPRRTQTDLVDELAQRRPKLVVFTSSGFGLPAWDGISNQVRHYAVSEYLLRNYRPVLDSH